MGDADWDGHTTRTNMDGYTDRASKDIHPSISLCRNIYKSLLRNLYSLTFKHRAGRHGF